MISGDYSIPVTVNGYQCRNCTDVANAKKNIDPAHPRSGANNVDAARDPSQPIEARLRLAEAAAARQGGTIYARGGIAAAASAAGAAFDLAA